VQSNSSKPEKLHHFFSMLQSVNKIYPSVLPSERKTAAGQYNSQHFRRVQDILKSPGTKEEATLTDDLLKRETSETTIQEPKEEEVGDSDLPGTQGEGLDSIIEEEILSMDLDDEEEIPSSSRSRSKPDQHVVQKNRRRHRKPGPGKARIKMTSTGPVKITRAGPPFFYMSGFASESNKDCRAINKYYAEWWADDRKKPYKGRQDRKKKKQQ
jgi:hypothetical protein